MKQITVEIHGPQSSMLRQRGKEPEAAALDQLCEQRLQEIAAKVSNKATLADGKLLFDNRWYTGELSCSDGQLLLQSQYKAMEHQENLTISPNESADRIIELWLKTLLRD